MSVSALGKGQALARGGAYLLLATAVVLALLGSPHGVWAFLLFFGLITLNAVINVAAALCAGVVFSWGRPVSRASDSTFYVFTIGVSIFIAAVATAAALAVLMSR